MVTASLRGSTLVLSLVGALTLAGRAAASDVVLSSQGEFLDAYLPQPDGSVVRRVFIDPDPPNLDDPASLARVGRHVNGQLCFFPDSAPKKLRGKFVIADDTYREACVETGHRQARCDLTDPTDPAYVGKDADGWGIFNADGTWSGRVLHVGGFSCDEAAKTCVQPIGTVDPQGCAFDGAGNLFGTDVNQGAIGVASGALVVFFNDSNAKKAYTDYCFVAKGLGAPGMPVVDDHGAILLTEATTTGGPLSPLAAALGVSELGAGPGRVDKFSFTAPLTPADCVGHELTAAGRTKVTRTDFMTFPLDGMITPESITRVPAGREFALPLLDGGKPHYYVGSVLLPPVINEYDSKGSFVRNVVLPFLPKNPIGMGVGSGGTLYYAELNLGPAIHDNDPSTLEPFATGCGSVSRVEFASGIPLLPETLQGNLAFPDGVTVVDSSRLTVDVSTLPLAPAPDQAGCQQEGLPSS
jgi:hypothetical protein